MNGRKSDVSSTTLNQVKEDIKRRATLSDGLYLLNFLQKKHIPGHLQDS